jgi:RNA polymerase sigma-70 factor (ECF subfamily)
MIDSTVSWIAATTAVPFWNRPLVWEIRPLITPPETPAEPDDASLLQAVQRGDADALVAIYDRYGRVAFALAYRVLGNAATAEEVVQDAFMRLWQQASSYDASRGNVRTWLLTIVHNRSIDMLRGRYGRQRTEQNLSAVAYRASSTDVWLEVSERLRREQVHEAVGTLPDDQQAAIKLAYFDGLTHQQIAEKTGLPLGTVKGRMRLGLRKLRGILDSGEMTDGGNHGSP